MNMPGAGDPEFLEQLHDEVATLARESGREDEQGLHEAFTQLVTDELAEYGVVDGLVPCRLEEKTSKGVVRCDGYWLAEDENRLDLFVSSYQRAIDGRTITQTEIRQAFERARRILQLVADGRDLGDPGRSDQAGMVAALRAAASSIKDVRVFILTDCLARDTQEIRETHSGRTTRCQIWDATRLARVRGSGKDYESIEIDVIQVCGTGIPCLPMPESDCGYRTYLAFIPGQMLSELYDEYGARLLQLNVRSFLQAQGKVNRGIRDTIINEPGRFLAYNNGLTATVESLQCSSLEGGGQQITWMKGFQVVNGGQTVASIHNAARKDRAPLDRILVQAKISVVKEDLLNELVSRISRYANTQNRVNEADFSSNDPLHVKIEELSERIWAPGEQTRWFYERARGQYQVAKARDASTPARRKKFEEATPTSQRFNKTDLAKFINSWGQHPHTVSKGAQKNFTEFMTREGTGLTPDESWYRHLIAQAIIFKKAESVARRLQLPSYRANAITYTVALLSYRTQRRVDLDSIWQNQAVSEAMEATMVDWMPRIHQALIESAGGRNVTEWCKHQDCWRHVQMLRLDLPAALQDEFEEGQPLPNVGADARSGRLDLTAEDRENIAKVMMVSDDVWLAIHRWGIVDDHLPAFHCGIAHTLISYAAGGWAKVPSKKQAKQAMIILETARGHVPELDRVQGL